MAFGGEIYAESLANLLALHLLRSHSSLGPTMGEARVWPVSFRVR
ncbi:MAG: hypothetical protein AVDCRST_MAG58-2838 [uncultured Rubrobacteraceae bacterium]|uniref:Uncharacterized protein n=1 Tax=uncultured Rubrobacteraceae bacterium TaxID=349277 RepID=A0A6J4R2I1_9ACTN|nr:MAG: hypothetical protein AVDCRST_MAG58-2838 [uncultured Rubrobacteraceae bacterium]